MVGYFVPELLLNRSRWFSPLNGNGSYLINPPKKIVRTNYRCDKRFCLDTVLDMYSNDVNSYGVVFITGKMYTFYRLIITGNHVEKKELCSTNVKLAKRHNKGGQSALRFSRLRDESEEVYINKIGELVVKWFMSYDKIPNIGKLFILGPSSKKRLLMENSLVQQYFRQNVDVMSATDMNEKTWNDVIALVNCSNSNDMDAVIQKVHNMMSNDIDKLVFGMDDIICGVEMNELEYIVCTNDAGLNDIELKKCQIFKVHDNKMAVLGVNIIGVRWYSLALN